MIARFIIYDNINSVGIDNVNKNDNINSVGEINVNESKIQLFCKKLLFMIMYIYHLEITFINMKSNFYIN